MQMYLVLLRILFAITIALTMLSRNRCGDSAGDTKVSF